MNATQKKKLCWNCEGRVPLDSENCPYCAVYVGPAPNDKDGRSILSPPYKIVEAEDQEETLPEAPFATNELNTEKDSLPSSSSSNNIKSVLLSLGLLSGGMLFFLFGGILLLFSEKGMLNLQWNSQYWYVYTIFSLPMLLLGWRFLSRTQDEDGQDFHDSRDQDPTTKAKIS